MAKHIEYDPMAILYQYDFKEEDGRPRLVGTDPVIRDITQFFRWINEPHGWERREPWQGVAMATAISNAQGAYSGWPGAIQLPARAVGRPKRTLADEDRPVSVSTSVRRAELFEIMRRAAIAKLSVSEWVARQIRAELEHEAKA